MPDSAPPTPSTLSQLPQWAQPIALLVALLTGGSALGITLNTGDSSATDLAVEDLSRRVARLEEDVEGTQEDLEGIDRKLWVLCRELAPGECD